MALLLTELQKENSFRCRHITAPQCGIVQKHNNKFSRSFSKKREKSCFGYIKFIHHKNESQDGAQFFVIPRSFLLARERTYDLLQNLK